MKIKKQIALLVICIACNLNLNAQTSHPQFDSLKTLLHHLSPEAIFNNKLIFLSMYTSSDTESVEMNKEAFRVYKIYKQAKLKNGERGTVFYSVSLDKNLHQDSFIDPTVVTTNDALISFIKTKFNIITPGKLMLFNTLGEMLQVDYNKESIFPTFRNLIIR